MYNIHPAKDHSLVHSINFALLDQFCVDYLYHEGLTEDNATVRGSQYDPFKRELEVLTQIRQQILDGCISAAIALITEIRPDFLKTRPRLAFRLCKQEFIELLRASPDNQAKALAFLQDRLVPLAHNGSPDADAELRKAMLYLVYGPRRPTDGAEDGAERRAGEDDEWTLTYLATLATHVHQRLLQYLGVHEPRLTLAARYLCIIHNMHHFIRGEELSVPEAEGLLMPDTEDEDEDEVAEAEAEEEEVTENEERSVAIREEDVNKLAQVTLQPHTQARCALVLAHGSLPSAFMASLSRMRISRPLVASLVTEYCAYRGLIVGNYIGESQLVPQDEVVAPAAEVEMDWGEEEAKRRGLLGFRKIRDLTTPPHPLTSGPSAPNDRPLSTQILDELHELGFDRPYVRMYAAHRDGHEMEFGVEEGDDDATPVSPQLYFALKRCEFLERIRAGEWERAVEGVREGMAPLTVHDPALVQPLKDTVMLLAYRDAPSVPRGLARRFLKGCGIDECVEGGDAERMAGTEWWGKTRVEDEAEAGVQAEDKGKEKQTGGIEEVVEEIWSKFNLYTLAGPLYAALGTYLGLPEPALVRIMAGLLEVHTKYYEMQQDEDRFAPILSIDLLKRPDPYMQPPIAKTKVNDEAKDEEALHEAEAVQSGLGLSREEVEKKEEAARRNHLVENDIATVQDVMACTRYEAIDMLLQHGGTLNGLLSELFG